MQFPLSNERAEKIAQGLAGLVDVESGPSEEQLKELETYAAAPKFDGPQLQAVRDLAHKSSAQATKDFLRVYDDSMRGWAFAAVCAVPLRHHQL